jgi:hypothetical protein
MRWTSQRPFFLPEEWPSLFGALYCDVSAVVSFPGIQ